MSDFGEYRRRATKKLADARAVEEQLERKNVLYGRGATPSMGLSQFRGGKKKHTLIDHLKSPHKGFGRGEFTTDQRQARAFGTYISDASFDDDQRDVMAEAVANSEDMKGGVRNPFRSVASAVDHFEKADRVRGGLQTGKYEGEGRKEEDMLRDVEIRRKYDVPRIEGTPRGRPDYPRTPTTFPKAPARAGPESVDAIIARLGLTKEVEKEMKKKGKGKARGKGFLSNLGIPVVSDIAGMIGLGEGDEREAAEALVELSERPILHGLPVAKPTVYFEKPRPAAEDLHSAMAAHTLTTMKKDAPKKGKGAGSDGRKARADVVKKVMAERGLSMIEASKVVKSEGLYKGGAEPRKRAHMADAEALRMERHRDLVGAMEAARQFLSRGMPLALVKKTLEHAYGKHTASEALVELGLLERD